MLACEARSQGRGARRNSYRAAVRVHTIRRGEENWVSHDKVEGLKQRKRRVSDAPHHHHRRSTPFVAPRSGQRGQIPLNDEACTLALLLSP